MADQENGPSNKNGPGGVNGKLTPFTKTEAAKFEQSFKELLLGYRDARDDYARAHGLNADSEEARSHGWKMLVRSTEKAREMLRTAVVRSEGKEVERMLRDILFEYVAHSEWREAHLFLRQFVPKELTSVFKDERLQKASTYFAVDAVMSGRAAFAGTFFEAMKRINPGFFMSKEYASALRDGVETIICEGRVAELPDFLHKLPGVPEFTNSRLLVLERAIAAALPERLAELGKLSRSFRIKDYLGGPEFQKVLELNLEHYLASRNMDKVLALKDSYGALVSSETKMKLEAESRAFLGWQRLKIEFLRGEPAAKATQSQASVKAGIISQESGKLAAAEDFLLPRGIPAAISVGGLGG